jgi:signal transduction histidine kinase
VKGQGHHVESVPAGSGNGRLARLKARNARLANEIAGQRRVAASLRRANQELTERAEARTRALSTRAVELEGITGVSSSLRKARTLDELLAILIQQTARAVKADAGSLLLLEDGYLVVAGLHGLPETLLGGRHPPGDDPLWRVMRSGQPLLSPSLRPEEFATGPIPRALADGMVAMAIVPVLAAERSLGLLQVAFRQPAGSFDEYRRMLTAIAEMAGNALQRVRAAETMEQAVRDRTRALTTLYEVTATTNEYLDLQTILERVLDKALEVMGNPVGLLHLLDENGEGLRLVAQRGFSAPSGQGTPATPPDGSPWGRVMESNQTVMIAQARAGGAALPAGYPDAPMHYVGVPIRAKGRLLGVLSVFGDGAQRFSAEDVALLASIGDAVGSAVETAQLRQRAEDAAVMDERHRLARELHDAVTQSLYSLMLFAEAGRDSARAGEAALVEDYLDRLGVTAQQALKEMRLLVYELYPLALKQAGLVEALEQRLEAVERRAGVEPELVIGDRLQLPAPVEADLYRIAQEALNNVLKHSAATKVTVRLGTIGDGLAYLEVRDNGRGFSPGGAGRSAGIGLISMRERAQNLGGSLQITSSPDQGTTVRVTFRPGAAPAGG